MAVSQFTYIPNRVIDADGISDGASLYFYLTGTTTPASIWSDSARTTPRANPVVVNAGAPVPNVYLNPAVTYRVVIKNSAGVTIEGGDIDPFLGLSASAISTDTGDTVQESLDATLTLADAAANTGAALIGTDSGDTVQEALDALTESLGSTIYASTITGDDTNSGRSMADAKATIGAVETLVNAGTGSIILESGSSWRDELATTGVSFDVAVAGQGGPAVIDGADVVSTWTAEGTANVWQASLSHSVASASNRFVVFQDGIPLTRVANVATCSSTAGSFVDVRSSSTSPITLKIHATGSGNPNSNERLYEASRRGVGIGVENTQSGVVRGPLEVGRTVENNGAVSVLGSGVVERVLAKWGTKHNMFVGEGSVRDCIAYGADKPTSDELSNSFFVSFQNDPTGNTYLYERCGGVQPLGTGSAFSGTLGFYAHSSNTSLKYTTGTLRQCWSVGGVFGGHATGAVTNIEEGCYWRAAVFISNVASASITASLGYIFKTYDGLAGDISVLNGVTMTDCGMFFEKRVAADAVAMRTTGGTNVLTRTTLVMGGAGTFNAHAFGSIATSGSFTCNNSVIAGFSGDLLNIPSGVTYTGNNNIFWTDNEFATTAGFAATRNGAGVATLSAWQTATGQDSNSVYAVRTDQVAGSADALFLGWKEAAGGTDLNTVGPGVGDFRLNPTAKLYNAAGTVRTGVLADNTTPIATNVGACYHWDWNKRVSVPGPSSAFPNVPETLDECRQYIAGPDRWSF